MLSETFRYFKLSDGNSFEKHHYEIYPPEFILEKENYALKDGHFFILRL